ncbi:MFS transporter [Furfurilactobacillus entadae]|uniref:hypothetical protein n=1 Tax=Furfurilactobacillus entadae TaxID=2922307 RepID=UPI0038B397DB
MASISVFGFFIGLFYRKLKLSIINKVVFVFIGFSSGMFLLSMGEWIPSLISMLLIGIALGLGMPFLNEWVSITSNDANRKRNIATSNAMIFAGQFMSPFVFQFLSKPFGFHERGIFFIAAVISAFQIIIVFWAGKNTTESAK